MEYAVMLADHAVNKFVLMTGIICMEFARYLELANEYAILHRQSFESETKKQEELYRKYLEVHCAHTNYCNTVYEFKSSLTPDLYVNVSYLEIVGIFIPHTYSTVYLQATFDGENDNCISMALNNQWEMNVGGLPEGTIIFTRKHTYQIEGDELVKLQN